MKFNWGTGIVLAFIGFISFIMYFVVIAHGSERANHDLVTEDYYRKELKYQEDIDAERNYKKLSSAVVHNRTSEGLLIRFPVEMEPEAIKGNVSLYRPSNKQLDFTSPISISNHSLLIPDERLLDGRWDIHLEWSYKGKNYLYKDKIMY